MADVPKTILAATDFSKDAETAAELARDLCPIFGARLHMLHVAVILDDAYLEKEHRRAIDEVAAGTEKARRTVLENDAEAARMYEIDQLLDRELKALFANGGGLMDRSPWGKVKRFFARWLCRLTPGPAG